MENKLNLEQGNGIETGECYAVYSVLTDASWNLVECLVAIFKWRSDASVFIENAAEKQQILVVKETNIQELIE